MFPTFHPITNLRLRTDPIFGGRVLPSLLHVQIKKERMEEKLRLARLSQRLHFQDEGRGRLSHLYKKILTALHRQRKVSELTVMTWIPSIDIRFQWSQSGSIPSVSEVFRG